MDAHLQAAARCLRDGDPLGALGLVGLGEESHTLALRGIALAQLGDLALAEEVMGRAALAFRAEQVLERARCHVALAEVRLASRQLPLDLQELRRAGERLEAHGDQSNAAYVALLIARHDLLVGEVAGAQAALEELSVPAAAPTLQAVRHLVLAEVALRQVRIERAGERVQLARVAADSGGNPALRREILRVAEELAAPAARLLSERGTQIVDLAAVECWLKGDALVVNGFRRWVGTGAIQVSLATRPLLFGLVKELAQGGPSGVSRGVLISQLFDSPLADDSHRVRLRVEIARLRELLKDVAEIVATPEGFALIPARGRHTCVLLPLDAGPDSAIAALMADGQAWSTAALAVAQGASQRSVQRALRDLESRGLVRSVGRGPRRRWLCAALISSATALLLPLLGASSYPGGPDT